MRTIARFGLGYPLLIVGTAIAGIGGIVIWLSHLLIGEHLIEIDNGVFDPREVQR